MPAHVLRLRVSPRRRNRGPCDSWWKYRLSGGLLRCHTKGNLVRVRSGSRLCPDELWTCKKGHVHTGPKPHQNTETS